MWLGFDQAQGWQMISTQYSSQDTSVSILQMYSLSPTILPNKLYAFKIMTLSKPTSIVSTKSIHKISLKSKDMGKIKAEIKALQRLREYACIIELYQVLGHNEENRVFFHQFMKKQRKNIALILQYCPNRTLYHYVRQSSLEEKSIVCICLQIWEIIKALRECQILHRDLRSVNLMMSNQGLKLIDFDCCFIKGYSQVNDLSFPFVQEVTAPQILTLLRDVDPDDQISSEQLYKSQQKCDLYAFGAIIYEMINKTSYERGKITQSTSQIFSRELITLMRELLNQNPEQRIKLQSIGHILTILAQKHQIHFIPMNKRQIHNSYTPFQGIQCDNSLSLQSSSSSSLSDWSFSSKSTLDKGAHTPTPTLSPTLDDSFY